MLPRALILMGSLVVFALGQPAHAQTSYTWNNPSGGNWNVAGNWLDGVVPTSGTGAILLFGDPTPLSGAYTATNNLGAFTFNRLGFFGNALPGSSTAITVTGDAANLLRLATFNGVLPTIAQGGSGSAVIGAFVEVVDNTTIGGTGVGLLSITGTLSGSGQLIINRPNLSLKHHIKIASFAECTGFATNRALAVFDRIFAQASMAMLAFH